MNVEKITVTIITLNEESNIKDCLESVSWADEVLVSDSGSTDATVEICRAHGAKVYIDAWLGYGVQKNLCAKRAHNKWVLNIDADERVSAGLKEEIGRLDYKSFDGYYIPRKNHFAGKWIRHGGWSPDYNLRLYNKDAGGFGERAVHEAVKVAGHSMYLSNPLVHYTYTGVADYLKRMERYSTLAAEEMNKSGKKASIIDLTIRPAFTFFKMYVLKLGFLDGATGMTLARLYAMYTHAKYTKLRLMQR